MAFDSASQSIAVSPSLARRIASFGIKEPMVIPNLVDERIFSPGAAVTDKTIFFTLCGISRQKGIDTLLEAIALWNPPANLFEFRIGGDGPMLDTYKAKALALGLGDRVRWLGPVSRDDAPRLFRECHVYVMPSMHETFGVVYAEALACGKPVIATRCGGPESIVKDFNGRLVDIGDVSGLSETMQTMAKHFDQYNSVMIRQDFEERFSRIAVVKQLKMLYSEILRGKKCAA
jgi:glycosyltransferase involved in cell wall biosynthesis